MAKRFVWGVMLVMLCASLQHAVAMGQLISVTKETQAKQGLIFTLEAVRVDDEAVLVRMEIPRQGKLKNVRSIGMRIGSGRPLVYAPLQTTPGKNGSLVVTFQVSPTLADKCSVDLTIPHSARSYEVYAVELKGYITLRK